MGFMTEVSILNDRWQEIRTNPKEFVEQIYENSISNGRESQYVIGQTTVAKTHHADDVRIYYAAYNSFFDIFPDKNDDHRHLTYHLSILKQMKQLIKLAEMQTKDQIQALD